MKVHLTITDCFVDLPKQITVQTSALALSISADGQDTIINS